MQEQRSPIREVELGQTYYSKRGTKVIVRGRSWYGNNCSIAMIEYITPNATRDKPPGHKWVLEESIFLKTFSE